jgi:nucleotide-binding universal stress UspA family protein
MNEGMKILIAYDGSDFADNAIDELCRAGLPRQARASIVFVQEKWLPMPSAAGLAGEEGAFVASKTTAARMARAENGLEVVIRPEKMEMLRRAEERLCSYFPEWETDILILEGSPWREITRQAKKIGANLIVVGCQGQTQSKFGSFGSVSQKIANEAPCSVRIVRGRVWKQSSPNRILIALDGTPFSTKVVREVADRMWLVGSEVRLVMAKDKRRNQWSVETEQKEDLWIEQFVGEARKTLEKTELKVTELIEEGDPKQIIVAAADEWGADCIFVGANNALNYFDSPLLGSVSTAVVARAYCTVEIVR